MESLKTIPLTQGKVALVDADDYERISVHKWCIHTGRNYPYAARGVRINGKQTIIKMHREIMNVTKSTVHIDHINRNGLDNRKINLRIATPEINARNCGIRKDNSSGYRGVSWDNRTHKWHAQIFFNKEVTHCGYYANIIDAAQAYDRAALRFRGDEAKLNFPDKKGAYDVWGNICGEAGSYYRTHRGKRIVADSLAVQTRSESLRDITSSKTGT